MRIVYAIILGMALVGCKDDKKKDEKVGGAPEGEPQVDGGAPKGEPQVDGVAPAVPRSSQRGSIGGGGADLSPEIVASRKRHEDKIAQLEARKGALIGEIANAERARPVADETPSAELVAAGEGLIAAVLVDGAIPRIDTLTIPADHQPFLDAVNAVPGPEVSQGDERTRRLRAALALLVPLVPPPSSSWRSHFATVRGAVDAEIEGREAGSMSNTTGQKTMFLRLFNQAHRGDPLYAAIDAYNAENTPETRAALLSAIERLDDTRRGPVQEAYERYTALRRGGMSEEQVQTAASDLERLRTELAQVESEIAAEKKKKI